MFQAILHIDPTKLTPDERTELARHLRWLISTYERNVETNFQKSDVDVLFVEILEGSLPTHTVVGTLSGLHRLWGADHEAILEIIIKSVNEHVRPERYTDKEFFRLTQTARPQAIMPRERGWRDDPRPPDPADNRRDLGRQGAPPPVHAL